MIDWRDALTNEEQSAVDDAQVTVAEWHDGSIDCWRMIVDAFTFFARAAVKEIGRMAVFTFSSERQSSDEAIIDATDRADTWIAAHQWRDGNGRSVYNVSTCMSTNDGYYTYTICLIGPCESVEIAPW